MPAGGRKEGIPTDGREDGQGSSRSPGENGLDGFRRRAESGTRKTPADRPPGNTLFREKRASYAEASAAGDLEEDQERNDGGEGQHG